MAFIPKTRMGSSCCNRLYYRLFYIGATKYVVEAFEGYYGLDDLLVLELEW
jgi:hypothetical protein